MRRRREDGGSPSFYFFCGASSHFRIFASSHLRRCVAASLPLYVAASLRFCVAASLRRRPCPAHLTKESLPSGSGCGNLLRTIQNQNAPAFIDHSALPSSVTHRRNSHSLYPRPFPPFSLGTCSFLQSCHHSHIVPFVSCGGESPRPSSNPRHRMIGHLPPSSPS